MKLAVPDMISNSYFPAITIIELGFFKKEGLDVELELIFPVDKAYAALRSGAVDFVGGSAHSALAAFPQWDGVKLLCAQAQGMYWFLVMHKDLRARRGDLGVVKGRSIGAAPWVDLGLCRLRIEARLDLERDGVEIAPVPVTMGQSVNSRCGQSPRGSQDRRLLGEWHGCGGGRAPRGRNRSARCAPRRWPETVFQLHDGVDRDERSPTASRAAVRAIAGAHAPLKEDVTLATKIGAKLFPPAEADLIAELIRRDLPLYDTAISRDFVVGMNQFARDVGILSADVPYEKIVATAS